MGTSMLHPSILYEHPTVVISPLPPTATSNHCYLMSESWVTKDFIDIKVINGKYQSYTK
jgi:hypothetical protein